GTTQEKHDTYYVYDIYGNLTYVIPPLLAAHYQGAGNLPTNWGDRMNDLGYVYRYDHRNRLVEKKLPGKGWEYMVYDKQDRLVATQDPNLRNDGGLWLFTKYDQFGRVVYTGIFNGGTSRSSVQTMADGAANNNNESRNSSVQFTKNGLGVYYTTNAFPTSFDEILSVNYYDNYEQIGFSEQSEIDIPNNLRTGTTADTGSKGLPTASYIRVLSPSGGAGGGWEKNLTYYDINSRPVVSLKQNHLGGYTETLSTLNFRGQPETVVMYHKRAQGTGETEVKTVEGFTYDSQGR